MNTEEMAKYIDVWEKLTENYKPSGNDEERAADEFADTGPYLAFAMELSNSRRGAQGAPLSEDDIEQLHVQIVVRSLLAAFICGYRRGKNAP